MYQRDRLRTLLLLGVSALAGAATGRADVRVCVTDVNGLPLPKAELLIRARQDPSVPLRGSQTGEDGCATLSLQSGSAYLVSARLEGFADMTHELGTDDKDVKIALRPAAAFAVEVTAARTPLPLDASASSVRILSAEQLSEAPGFTLDDRLRGVPGFQLFRRTGSYVANPTTQGTSLRGLGSTAASRTLVLSDQVPLNDAFGGWIHWNEVPELAIGGVEVVRGGASDLYGSSAIGGVIDVNPVPAGRRGFGLDLAGASEATSSVNGLLAGEHRGLSALAAMTLFRTGGYILTAPEFRGAVDVPSDVHWQSGRVELARRFPGEDRAFLRGNVLNEARGNGTPLQTNGTRLWRYAAGADWARPELGRVLLRGYGDTQSYRQSFSAIAPGRATEQISRLQRVPSEQVGGSAQWARSVKTWTLVAGADVLDTRGTDNETPFSKIVLPTIVTSARQRDVGGYGEVLWNTSGGWSAAISGRVDRFRSFDARQGVVGGAVGSLAATDETVFDPRLGLVRRLGHGLSVSGSVFRAFRGPTLNELYRTGQVGQQTTLANPSLLSERATGWEGGGLWERSPLLLVRSSYFWTEVNRPVAAVTVASTPTTLTQKRENLGQLRSRGVSVEGEMRPVPRVVLTAGYQLAVSTVTRFQADPTLVGKWTPEVPRNSFTVQGRWDGRRWGTLALDLRTSGRQYDDSANVYELHGYTEVGGYYERTIRERLSGYASVQNLLDRRIEAGRTPLLTLGTPRLVEIGIRLR